MSEPSKKRSGRLLVVDDNKVNRLLLGRGLTGQGHSVEFAENGRQALEMLRQDAYDLLLLDIMMPEMDGYQVLEQIVEDLQLRNIPVIMTTAMDELNSVVKCIEMGAEDYLTKPVNPVLLRARVGASLEKKWLRDQQLELIKTFASEEVAEQMLSEGFELGGHLIEGTAMFSDIRDFTTISESQTPVETIELLNTYYMLMFEAITGNGGVVNQMIGDGLMAIFGAPIERPNRRAEAVRAAQEMIEMVNFFNMEQAADGKVEIRIGIGIASGPLVAGFAGTQRRATYTCVGDTVNLAARLEAQTKVVGEPILVDEATRQGLGEDVEVVDHGLVPIKGKANKVRIYSVATNG